MTKFPHLNGKIVEIIAYIKKKDRWGVKLIDFKGYNKNQQRKIAVKDKHLLPISNPDGMFIIISSLSIVTACDFAIV